MKVNVNWYKRKAEDVLITSPKKRQKSGVDPEVVKEEGPQDVGTEDGQDAAAAAEEDAGRHQDGEQDGRLSSQSQITPNTTQSATIQAAVARYVHVPIEINNVLNLTNQTLGTPAVDEGQTDLVVGNNTVVEGSTEGGVNGVGNVVVTEEGQTEPVVGNNNVNRVGNGPWKSARGRSQVQGVHQKVKANKKKPSKKNIKKEVETVAVMFEDQMVGGMLAKRLQKAEDAIPEMVGYRVRMV